MQGQNQEMKLQISKQSQAEEPGTDKQQDTDEINEML